MDDQEAMIKMAELKIEYPPKVQELIDHYNARIQRDMQDTFKYYRPHNDEYGREYKRLLQSHLDRCSLVRDHLIYIHNHFKLYYIEILEEKLKQIKEG